MIYDYEPEQVRFLPLKSHGERISRLLRGDVADGTEMGFVEFGLELCLKNPTQFHPVSAKKHHSLIN
jgi:hypothetical protein